MSTRLTSIFIEDFRSIRGPQRISLDAPAVLIHGPNGTGKTSLLSAIEFGLTGTVGSLSRLDAGFLKHLPHKRSPLGECKVILEAEGFPGGAPPGRAEVLSDGQSVTGAGLLSPDLVRFFSERCYLPQAALGRLLEIYEHQDNRRSDSPLTRFVKELLGLEALDALIDGLHASGDVRRLKAPAPLFTAARSGAAALSARVEAATKAAANARATVSALEAELREKLQDLATAEAPIDVAALESDLEAEASELELRLQDLARRRRDLLSASDQLTAALAAEAGGQVATAEAAANTARTALEAWQVDQGRRLQTLFQSIRAQFPSLADGASSVAATHRQAADLVQKEIVRLQDALDRDAADAKALAEVEEALRQGNARLTNIDEELDRDKGANDELARALTAISAHIDDEVCPVCQRDFREVSEQPLASHVSEEVERLVAAAGRVQGLVRDRSTTSSAVEQAQRRKSEILSRQLADEQRDAFKVDLAQLLEWRTGLNELVDAAALGTRLQTEASAAAGALSGLVSRRTGLSGLRAELDRHAQEMGRPVEPSDVPLQTVVGDLLAFLQREEEAGKERQAQIDTIGELLESLPTLGDELVEAEAELKTALEEQQTSTAQREEAERRIAASKSLATRAQTLRTEKVRQVFNDELNSVWRELFIRLAPDEEFVPAFALPPANGGPVEAVLETLYRAGGKGGNPKSMLSAGNLNTAALTLFLALNLSAKPLLPWLIIDDPVQSMDDVHIAQFAALLRTLKREGRQVFLAVHDRQLFDYLALELSPTVNGDRLITIELGRTAEGMTTSPWTPTVFEPDRAVAA